MSLELCVFDVEGALLRPTVRKALRTARTLATPTAAELVPVYRQHSNAAVFRVLDELTSSVDVVVLSDYGLKRETELLAFLQQDFIPRVGGHLRRLTVSFRTQDHVSPRDKVRRLTGIANVCRVVRGAVHRPKTLRIYTHDDDLIQALKRARRKHLLLPEVDVRHVQYNTAWLQHTF